MKKRMIFDAHVHVSGTNGVVKRDSEDEARLPGYSNMKENRWKAYLKEARAKSVFKAVIFPFPFPELAVEDEHQVIGEAYRRNRELFIPFGLVHPGIRERDIVQNGFRGLKEHFYMTGGMEDRVLFPVYDVLQQHGLFLLIHPHMKERITKIEAIKENFPRLKVILAHSGRKWPFSGEGIVEEIVPQLKKYDELYFDTSTIRDSATIAGMVNTLGSRRILFGSDYPFFREEGEDIYARELGTIDSASISEEDRENILAGNFKRLFIDGAWVRRCCKSDSAALIEMVESIDDRDMKYLALRQKMPVLRQNIRDERHIFVLENEVGLLGFARESGRPENGAVLEEIYISRERRQKGLAGLLLETVAAKFAYMEAKTFSENSAIAALFKKHNFSIEQSSKNGNILYWKRTDG